MKKYTQILPFPTDKKVKDTFDWHNVVKSGLPLSVVAPTKSSKLKWKDAYLDIQEKRRSDGCKYLPGLRFSEFHAGMAETIITYWSMQGSIIVDPFAGRVTRAFVATTLNRKYYGYEVSPTTIKRVNEHLKKHNLEATIFHGDGCKMSQTPDNFADLVFSCPPYHGLEKYESCDHQLSDVKAYDDFLEHIALCGKNIKRVLKPGAFCIWNCADWRDSTGYKLFHVDTINLFKKVGLIPHDIIIMTNMSPFAPLQAGKVAASRKTAKIHEYILVFRKAGDYIDPPSEIIKEATEQNKFWK